jgi:hypothetical protein
LTAAARRKEKRSSEDGGGSELGSSVHGDNARERNSRESEEVSEGE